MQLRTLALGTKLAAHLPVTAASLLAAFASFGLTSPLRSLSKVSAKGQSNELGDLNQRAVGYSTTAAWFWGNIVANTFAGVGKDLPASTLNGREDGQNWETNCKRQLGRRLTGQ